MKVIVSDFQADCLTTGQRESRKKAFQNVNAHSSLENYRLNREQLTLTASPKEEAVSSASISEFISAKLAPGRHHGSNAARYWLVCGFDGRPFGGLYYCSAGDRILTHFEGWRGPVITTTFGIVAEQALQLRSQHLGVAE